MIRTLLNWRYGVLMLLFAIGMIGVLGAPSTEDMGRWLMEFLISKAVGAVSLYGFVVLLRYWWRKGSINELTRLAEDDE